MNTSAEIETKLARCVGRDPQLVAEFLRAFLEATFVVPQRQQAQTLSRQPTYPNPLVSLLGVADGPRTIVPLFTRQELVEAWSGQPLRVREMRGADILTTIPEGWWLVLNPGQEVEKEFSPWEIRELSRGPGAIPEVVAEISADDDAEPVQFRQPVASERAQAAGVIEPLLTQYPQVVRVGVLIDEARREDARGITWAVGIEIGRGVATEVASQIRCAFEQAFQQHLIGEGGVSVWVGTGPDDIPTLGMFRSFEPLFLASSGVSGLMNSIKSLLLRR